MLPIVLVLVLVGALPLAFALLALSQDRHWHGAGSAMGGLTPRLRIGTRAAGWVLLAATLPAAAWRDGTAFGVLLWVCLLPIAAFAVTAILTWRAHWLQPLCLVILAAAGRRRS